MRVTTGLPAVVANVTVALRDAADVFACTSNVTLLFPDPVAVSAVNQDTPDSTDTLQAVFDVTVTGMSPAVAAGDQLVGVTVNVGAAPA